MSNWLDNANNFLFSPTLRYVLILLLIIGSVCVIVYTADYKPNDDNKDGRIDITELHPGWHKIKANETRRWLPILGMSGLGLAMGYGWYAHYKKEQALKKRTNP